MSQAFWLLHKCQYENTCEYKQLHWIALKDFRSYLQVGELGNQMIPAVHEVLMVLRDRVRRCYREKCSRLFLRTKGQLYCSKQCAQKDRIARFREGRRQQRAGITGPGVDTQSPME